MAPVGDLGAAKPLTHATDRPISYFFQWAYTNRHVVFFQERDGDENWRASSVDIRDGTVVPLTLARGVRAWVHEVSQREGGCRRATEVRGGSRHPEVRDRALMATSGRRAL